MSRKLTIYFIFLVSGTCGLIYEVLWSRYLGLFIGNTTYAHAIVLATFMGGLALGNAILGRYADKVKAFLVGYAYLEIAIGIYAFCTPIFFIIMRALFINIGQSFVPGSGAIQTLKILFAFPVILIPSTLMGGTLPFMARVFIGETRDVKRETSVLYAINSFGAVFGSLITAFFLIPTFGLNVSLVIAAILNLAAGVAAITIHARMKGEVLSFVKPSQTNQKIAAAKPAASTEKTSAEIPVRALRIALLAAGISGFTAMCYEMAWFRFFALTLGSSTYSFSIMLAAFISGITIGSALIPFIRKKNLLHLIAWCQLSIGIVMAVSLLGYERIPYIFLVVKGWITPSTSTFFLFETVKYLFCFSIMIVPTIFFGMTLPLITSIESKSIDHIGKTIGSVFSVNTIGAVFGSLAAGFILLPLLGIQKTFVVITIINTLLGVLIFFSYQPKGVKNYGKILVPGVLVFVVLIQIVAPTWSVEVLNTGVFRKKDSFGTFQKFKAFQKLKTTLYHKDGTQVTVIVGKQASGDGIFLKVNGKPDASTSGDIKTQIMLSQLPLILHPNPKTVFNIGIGSGMTCGGILLHPIERLDVAEISKEVYEASHVFGPYNNYYFKDPRTHVFIEDAKTFLQLVKRKYDVIVSEPSNPWISGVGSLFTQEFFLNVKEHLNEGGIFTQWFHIYEMGEETTATILRTLSSVFPYISVWIVKGNDVIMIATEKPFSIDFSNIKNKLARPEIKKELARVDIHDTVSLLTHQINSPHGVKNLVTPGIFNRDTFPYLEYQAPKDFFYKKSSTLFFRYNEKTVNLLKSQLSLAHYLNNFSLSEKNFQNLCLTMDYGDYQNDLKNSIIQSWDKTYPESTHPTKIKGLDSFSFKKEFLNVLEKKKLAEEYPYNESYVLDYVESFFNVYQKTRSIFFKLDTNDWIAISKNALDIVSNNDKYKNILEMRTLVFYKEGMSNPDRGNY